MESFLSFFLLEIETASPAAVGVCGVHWLWWLVALYLRDRVNSKQPAKVDLLLTVYGICVPIAVGGRYPCLHSCGSWWASPDDVRA